MSHTAQTIKVDHMNYRLCGVHIPNGMISDSDLSEVEKTIDGANLVLVMIDRYVSLAPRALQKIESVMKRATRIVQLTVSDPLDDVRRLSAAKSLIRVQGIPDRECIDVTLRAIAAGVRSQNPALDTNDLESAMTQGRNGMIIYSSVERHSDQERNPQFIGDSSGIISEALADKGTNVVSDMICVNVGDTPSELKRCIALLRSHTRQETQLSPASRIVVANAGSWYEDPEITNRYDQIARFVAWN